MNGELERCYLPVGLQCAKKPSDIQIAKYVIPNTLGKTELEEAAARILIHSQICDQWVGVSWNKILIELRSEYSLLQARDVARSQNTTRKKAYTASVRRYNRWKVWTFGVSTFFMEKPELIQVEIPDGPDVQFSVTHMKGPRVLASAIRSLIEAEMLIEGGDDENNPFFVPTLKLINAVAR